MPWSRNRPGGKQANAKYATREHRQLRAQYAAQLARDGYLTCTQDICRYMRRPIRPGEKWHLGHDSTGTRWIGPTHAACNLSDAGRRARARQTVTRLRW